MLPLIILAATVATPIIAFKKLDNASKSLKQILIKHLPQRLLVRKLH
jgi:hypothetical protein